MFRSPFQSSSGQTPQHRDGNSRPQQTCSCKCTCTAASRQSSRPFSMLGQNDLPTSARKRAIDEFSQADKENQSPDPSSPPPKKQKRAYTKRRTIDEKLSDILL
jgi:hypothetical protein